MICVVLPIHNEAEMLEIAIREVLKTLDRSNVAYVLILAEDASTDGSYELCKQYAKSHENIIHIHSEIKKGRGDALKRVVLFIEHHFKDDCEIVGYLDTDLSTRPKFIIPALEKIIQDKYDIVIGSRRLKASTAKRGTKRRIFSWGYNTLINVLFQTGIHDHQCGFKFFKFDTTKEILLSAEDNKWFWDTEVLVRAKRKGLQIYEMPIEWFESHRDSKVSVWRDTKDMLISAFKLKMKLWREHNG